jgi:hypothetical protein
MLIVVAGMAIGVVCGRRPIAGSCGGLGALGIDAECEICGGDRARCDAPEAVAQEIANDTDLGYRVDIRR